MLIQSHGSSFRPAATAAPDVDVLLVSYNQSTYISKALRSILGQRYTGRIRVIVADDASNDDTLEQIRNIAGAQQNIEFVFLRKSENLGITRNYQRAFAASTAPYVAILGGLALTAALV